jgi:hypothetical protein
MNISIATSLRSNGAINTSSPFVFTSAPPLFPINCISLNKDSLQYSRCSELLLELLVPGRLYYSDFAALMIPARSYLVRKDNQQPIPIQPVHYLNFPFYNWKSFCFILKVLDRYSSRPINSAENSRLSGNMTLISEAFLNMIVCCYISIRLLK